MGACAWNELARPDGVFCGQSQSAARTGSGLAAEAHRTHKAHSSCWTASSSTPELCPAWAPAPARGAVSRQGFLERHLAHGSLARGHDSPSETRNSQEKADQNV